MNNLQSKKEELEEIKEELDTSLKDKYQAMLDKVTNLKKQLDLLNPKGILSRGYSIVSDEKGNIIKSTKEIKIEDNLHITLSDGDIETTVKKVKSHE